MKFAEAARARAQAPERAEARAREQAGEQVVAVRATTLLRRHARVAPRCVRATTQMGTAQIAKSARRATCAVAALAEP